MICILFCTVSINLCAQEKHSLKDLVKYFNEINVPFNTEQINSCYQELPYNLSLEYFFKGDSANSYYHEAVYNMEDQSLMSSGFEKKIVLPRNHFYIKQSLFLVYKLISDGEDSYTYLAFMNNEGFQSDSLIISFATTSSPELHKWVRAKIYEDKVVVYEYNRVPLNMRDYHKNATDITVCHYTIDFNVRKFNILTKETFNSKFEIYQLSESDSDEIKHTDPYYFIPKKVFK